MKIAILSVCALCLAFTVHGSNAQTVVPQSPGVQIETVPPTATLKYETFEVGIEPDPQRSAGHVRQRLVAKNVQIQIGQNVLTADEAHVQYGPVGQLDVVELRGTVHLTAKLRIN